MKKFNVNAICIPKLHYMVDVSSKINQIKELIDRGEYFTINKARQFGKTTTISQLSKVLEKDYIPIRISFEGLGDLTLKNETIFSKTFLELIMQKMKRYSVELFNIISDNIEKIETLFDVSKLITIICETSHKQIVLMIDEVDKCSGSKIFFDFLGVIRKKYIEQREDLDFSFQSVILVSVVDIKNIKVDSYENSDNLNSPWNIAEDFIIDMSFNENEIESMLIEYEIENKIKIDSLNLSKEIFKYSNGYPYLISRICKIIDERLNKNWTSETIENAVNLIVSEKSTLMESVNKNLKNNSDLKELVTSLLIDGEKVFYNEDNDIIANALMYGLVRVDDEIVKIHNLIFEKRIYNYLISELRLKNIFSINVEEKNQFILSNSNLNIEKILIKFQEFMKDLYSKSREKFIEDHGRLIFLAFLKPILNGKGYYFIEVNTRSDKRLDLVITYNREIHIVELKIWHGKDYEDKGIKQLGEYLDYKNQNIGYLLSFCFNKNMNYKFEWTSYLNKKILIVNV